MPKIFKFLGKKNTDIAGNLFAQMGNFKDFLKKKTNPVPKTNYGCRKTKWEIFKNHRCSQKNDGKGFLNLELELGFQMWTQH